MYKVSVITPTTLDREFFNDRITRLIKKQKCAISWEHLFDYGDGTIGEKRNRLCERAKGRYIIHADSDDEYDPLWLGRSIKHLIDTKADITGLSQAYFSKPPHLYEYTYQGGQPYVIGASMCYWRRVWEKQPFKHINSGEDALFQVNNLVIPHTYKEGFTANIHGGNTASHLQLNKKEFRLVK